MRACCAAEFLGREEPIYRTPDTDALTNAFQRFVPQDEARALAERLAARGPLEVQLLQSYGIWPLKSLLETSRVFLRRQAA